MGRLEVNTTTLLSSTSYIFDAYQQLLLGVNLLRLRQLYTQHQYEKHLQTKTISTFEMYHNH